MYQRPSTSETDDDLLNLQEEFLKNKQNKDFQLAAKVVSSEKQKGPSHEIQTTDIQEHLDNTFENIPKNFNIGCIVEKKQKPVMSQFNFAESGFPRAKRREGASFKGKGSLFAQQMKKQKTGQSEPMEIDDTANDVYYEDSKAGTSTDDGIHDEIHQQNLCKIKEMSEEDILEEKEKLLSTLDPAIVAFLKARHNQNKNTKEQTKQPSIAKQNNEQVNIEEIDSVKEIIDENKSEKWIHFDALESSKLAWMKNMEMPKLSKEKQYEARFDFGGWLMPFTEPEINEKNRILYHHGEESGRPGYTLNELFQLCRSNVAQQKIVALNAIANILDVANSGAYEGIIDIPIEQTFFVLRFCLDENSPAILNASVKAMRNLFYHKIDETCLDYLLNFGLYDIQPMLGIDNDDDDNTVNDQQLAETNMVKCLLRSGILTRIRYIFNTVRPNELETIVHSLNILIRLARDSDYVAQQVFKFEGLIVSVIGNFLPPVFSKVNFGNVYEAPVIEAVKFIRLLSCRNAKYAAAFANKFKIMEIISTYLSNEFVSLNTPGLKLQIEVFKLWTTLLHFNESVEYFNKLEPVLLRLMDYYLQNTNLDSNWTIQEHAAAFFNLITKYLSIIGKLPSFYVEKIMEHGVPKWTSQFMSLQSYACGRLQLFSSFLNLVTELIKAQVPNVNWTQAENLIKSKGFNLVTQRMELASNVLNNYKVHENNSNFKYTEAAAWNTADHIVPVLQSSSCIPFITSLSSLILQSDSQNLKLLFLQHENVKRYLHSLQSSNNFYLTSNWYTKIETVFILNVLRISYQVKDLLDTGSYYEIAVKSLSLFTFEQKEQIQFILEKIIFNKDFFPAEAMLQNLSIQDRDILQLSLRSLDDIKLVYTKVLGLHKDLIDFTKTQLLDIKLGNIIPLDWIYSPIIALYSNQPTRKNQTLEDEQTNTVSNCLRWIHIYETYFPSLAAVINPTDKFCRLICTFLGSDTLFLQPEIQNLLTSCLKMIISQNERNLDFSKAIHGLKSFEDLYLQLLEQYQGVSYGDKLFGNFILIPLAQRHSVKFRKTLWSEYAAIVQIFNVSPDEIFVDIESFLYPEEEDVSLLKCYQKIVASGKIRKSSVLYKIVMHHLECYRIRMQRSSN